MKSANSWLRGLLRAGKKQQRTASRALTILIAPPKAKPKPKPKPKPKATPALRIVPRVAPAAPAIVARAPARPALQAAGGKWLASHFSGVKRMSYWLYLPDRIAPPKGLPLIVMLHGCEQSATMFAQGTRMNQHAEKAGFAVLYPQQSVSSHPRRCWKWYERATQQGGGDAALIVGVLNKVLDSYPIDRSRVFICGMSAGAGMAHIVALNHPDLFAALGLHSGPSYGAGHSTVGALGVMQHGAGLRVDSAIDEVLRKHGAPGTLPTMLIQGDKDEVVRPVNQAQLARQARRFSALGDEAATASLKPGGRRVLAHRLHDVYRGRKLMLRVAEVADLGHAWSGGDERVAYHSGPGPDASKMLLSFFSKHRRPAS
ncbi:MAG: PHB depolymerase family esterase [Pseudomonadota bacterium]